MVLRKLLDVQRLPAFNLTKGDAATIFTILRADLLAHASSKGIYHGRFRVNLTHEEIAGILTLRPGVVFQDGPYRLAIDDVTEPTGMVRINQIGFGAQGVLIRFPPEYTRQDQSFSLTQSWLDGAELVIVRLTREGSVERELSFDFTLLPVSSGTPCGHGLL